LAADRTPLFVGEYADPATQTASAELQHFSSYAVLQYQHRFLDIAGSWAQHAVAVAAAHMITTGVSPTTFAPSRTLTRATLVTTLARGLDLPRAAVIPSRPPPGTPRPSRPRCRRTW